MSIISEDKYAAKQYFEEVLNPLLKNLEQHSLIRLFQFEVLETSEGDSGPKQLHAQLEALLSRPKIKRR